MYVAPDGKDSNDGSFKAPLASIALAVQKAKVTKADVVLRGGDYFLSEAIVIEAEDSGLTIRNHNGEDAVVTGAKTFKLPKSAWKLYKQEKGWDRADGFNNVFGAAQSGSDTDTVKYLGTFDTTDECIAALEADKGKKGPFQSFSHHSRDFGDGFAGQCFGRTDDFWSVHAEAKVNSGTLKQQNVWRADVSHLGLNEMPGLRLNGRRAIRAKYPNGDPEMSGHYLLGADAGMGGGDYVKGWTPLTAKTEWVKPARKPDAEELVATAKDWPSVEWPMSEDGGSSWTGEGDWGEYHLGLGGYCDDLSPPVGYWCSMEPPRGQCWDRKTNTGSGCTQTHMSPDGMVLERALQYSDPTTAVVQSWRGGGRWFTQQWRVESFDRDTATLKFDPTTGHQGGEGMTSSGQWWIENVKEECDSANEWFFDAQEQMLYFNPNSTDAGPTGEEQWAVPLTRVLFNISGTQEQPVKDVSIKGLTLRDTRHTYFDERGMPSGGDWTLQRSATVILEGTEGCKLADSLISNVDGNGIGLNGYNRNASIMDNDFEWIGDSAMYAWGYTGYCLDENCTRKLPYKVGPDGRGGEQPRGTRVSGNLVREIGIWQKQSSMWFQAVTAETVFEHNVHFNGPRAGININDGFGGGDIFRHNLLLNCVRESGDHGPVNSWDRVPYVTDIATGKPSIIPKWREFSHNFFLAVYSSQQAIDNDDGSAYWSIHDNFFVYGANGVKSDFGGQWNHHVSNVYGYVGTCWGMFSNRGSGAHNQFVNNKCVSKSAHGGFLSDCDPHWFGKEVIGNSIFNKDGKLNVNICDPSNTVSAWPSDESIIAMAKVALSTNRELPAAERTISVRATGKLWRADDDGDSMVTTVTKEDDFSIFILERQVDGSYRIRVKADGKYLHLHGTGDQLLSTRYQPDDDYTRFFFEGPDANGLWRLKVKANGKYLYAGDNDNDGVGTNHQTADDYSRFSLAPASVAMPAFV
jgi:hypothetical protein